MRRETPVSSEMGWYPTRATNPEGSVSRGQLVICLLLYIMLETVEMNIDVIYEK